MSKRLLWFLAGVILVSLAGCSDQYFSSCTGESWMQGIIEVCQGFLGYGILQIYPASWCIIIFAKLALR
jgi:hypothetical protein